MVTPPSASALSAASDARSTTSLSGCFPNLVMWMPRIQTSSAMACSSRSGGRFETEPDGLGAGLVGADGERGEADLHARLHVLGVGLDVHDVGPDAGAVAVHDAGDERHGDARRRE